LNVWCSNANASRSQSLTGTRQKSENGMPGPPNPSPYNPPSFVNVRGRDFWRPFSGMFSLFDRPGLGNHLGREVLNPAF